MVTAKSKKAPIRVSTLRMKMFKDKTLSELYSLIGGTDKHNYHRYDGLYGPILKSKRFTAKKVLEVGVSCWGSGDLEALGHYFPNAEVHGIDTDPLERVKEEHQAPNIIFHQMDGYDYKSLDETFGDSKWDVVLDDGPHTIESQIKCLNYFHDKLAPNGVIIVEDIQRAHENPSPFTEIRNAFEGTDMYLSFIDRHRGACVDDMLAMYWVE